MSETTTEQWLDIPGHPKYMASNLGRIKNKARGNVLKPANNGLGYFHVVIDGKNKYAHSLVATAFIEKGVGTEVNHIDGNKSNNVVTNLEWVTKSENVKHSFRMGLNHTPKERILKMCRAQKDRSLLKEAS